jgi:hypothetical protein
MVMLVPRPWHLRRKLENTMLNSAVDGKRMDSKSLYNNRTVNLANRKHRYTCYPKGQQPFLARFIVCAQLFLTVAPLQLVCFSVLAMDTTTSTFQDEPSASERGGRKKRGSRGLYHQVMETYDAKNLWNGLDSYPDIANAVISHDGNRRALMGGRASSSRQKENGVSMKSMGKGGKKSAKEKKKKRQPPPPRPSGRPPNPRPHPTPGSNQAAPWYPKPTKNQPHYPPQSSNSGGPGLCVTSLNVEFLQFAALPPAVFVDPNDPNEQVLGTQFVYNDALYNQTTMDEIRGSRATGVCTRTQYRINNSGGPGDFQVGGGYCQFVYTLFTGGANNRNPVTFTAAGAVRDRDGGVLPITGGAQGFVGAYGELELIPVLIGTDQKYEVDSGDFFLSPLLYLADAAIFIPCKAET